MAVALQNYLSQTSKMVLILPTKCVAGRAHAVGKHSLPAASTVHRTFALASPVPPLSFEEQHLASEYDAVLNRFDEAEFDQPSQRTGESSGLGIAVAALRGQINSRNTFWIRRDSSPAQTHKNFGGESALPSTKPSRRYNHVVVLSEKSDGPLCFRAQ